MRFVKSNKGKALLPALAVTDFTKEKKQHLRYFKKDNPYKAIGLAVHPHFAKSKVLEVLIKDIATIVEGIEGIRLLD